MILHLADNVHFTRTAVKLQRQHFIAINQLHRRRFPAFNIAFRLFRAKVKGKAQAVFGDHHRDIALLFMRFIRGVNQLHAVTMIKRTRLVVVNVRQEGEMGVRVDRRRHRFGLTAAARIVCQTGFIQHLGRFTAELVQQAVRHKQRIRQVHLNITRVIEGLPQLRHAILKAVERFLRIVRHLEHAVEGMRDADTVFTGHGQDQLLFPAPQRDIHRNAALAGGFEQGLLPVVVQVTVQRRVGTRFVEIGWHFVRPDAIAIFTGFLHRIGAETHHFTFDHHVEAIAVRQRLCHLNVKMVFRHFQHFTYRQADKLW